MKERFCRSDELKYLLLGERGCQVPSDFIVFRIFSFHFLLLTSICILISFSRWEAPRSPAASFSLLYHRYLSPPLSLSTDGANIHEKEAKAYFSPSGNLNNFETRNSNICLRIALRYILLFIQKIWSSFCQGQIKDQIWIVIQHVFFLLKEKQQWEFPDKQSSFKIFPAFSENISS